MNKRKLEALAKFLEKKVPESNFDLSTWIHLRYKGSWNIPYTDVENIKVCKTEILNNPEGTVCGTTCCVAGWDVIRSGYCINDDATVFESKRHKKPLRFFDDYDGIEKDMDAYEFSKKNLGLSDTEATKLFLFGGWERSGKDFPNTPQGAAERIRYFIQTGL